MSDLGGNLELSACVGLVCVVTVGCASVSGVPNAGGVPSPTRWQDAACAYSTALREHMEERDEFSVTVHEVVRSREALEHATVPDVPEILQMLDSAAESKRACGLAAVEVRGIVPDAIVLRIISNFANEGVLGRYLSGLALGRVTSAQVREHGRAIAAALASHPTSLTVNTNRGVLLRLDKEVAIELLISFMTRNDQELRISVCDVVFRREDGLGQEFMAELRRRGMSDELELAARVESVIRANRNAVP